MCKKYLGEKKWKWILTRLNKPAYIKGERKARRKEGFGLQCRSRKTFSRLKEVLHLSGMGCLSIHSTLFSWGRLQEVEPMEAGIWRVQNDGAGSSREGLCPLQSHSKKAKRCMVHFCEHYNSCSKDWKHRSERKKHDLSLWCAMSSGVNHSLWDSAMKHRGMAFQPTWDAGLRKGFLRNFQV